MCVCTDENTEYPLGKRKRISISAKQNICITKILGRESVEKAIQSGMIIPFEDTN